MTKAVYGGRPRAFKTPEALAEKLEAYKIYTKEQQSIDKYTPTILAFSEFCDLHSSVLTSEWLNDPDKKDYHEIIKKIKRFCMNGMLQNGLDGKCNPIMAIFALKAQHGWQDKQVIEQTTTHNFSLRNLHADMSKLATVEEVKPQQLVAKEQKEGSISDEV